MLVAARRASAFSIDVVVVRDRRQAPVVCEMVPERLGKAYGAEIVGDLIPEREVSERSFIYLKSD